MTRVEKQRQMCDQLAYQTLFDEATRLRADRDGLLKTLDEMKALLLETTMRANLALPMNKQQDKWFYEGTPVYHSGDFQERLYKTLNIGQK